MNTTRDRRHSMTIKVAKKEEDFIIPRRMTVTGITVGDLGSDDLSDHRHSVWDLEGGSERPSMAPIPEHMEINHDLDYTSKMEA